MFNQLVTLKPFNTDCIFSMSFYKINASAYNITKRSFICTYTYLFGRPVPSPTLGWVPRPNDSKKSGRI